VRGFYVVLFAPNLEIRLTAILLKLGEDRLLYFTDRKKKLDFVDAAEPNASLPPLLGGYRVRKITRQTPPRPASRHIYASSPGLVSVYRCKAESRATREGLETVDLQALPNAAGCEATHNVKTGITSAQTKTSTTGAWMSPKTL